MKGIVDKSPLLFKISNFNELSMDLRSTHTLYRWKTYALDTYLFGETVFLKALHNPKSTDVPSAIMMCQVFVLNVNRPF